MTQEEEDKIIYQRDEWFRKNIKWLKHDVQYKICKGPMSEYADELLQVAVLQFLNKPLEVQHQMVVDEKAGWYILVTATRHIQSSTSPFYSQIRKFKMSTRSGALPEISNEDDPGAHPFEAFEWYQCYKKTSDSMNFYYKALLEDKYMHQLTFDEIRAKYDITKNSLVNDIRLALQYVRCKCDPSIKC